MPTENRSSNTEKALTFTEGSLAAALEKVQSLHELSSELIAEAVFRRPAEHHQGEPVGEVVAFGEGLHEIAWAAGRMPKLGAKLYTHADPGEVEGLVSANTEFSRRHLAQLDEIQLLSAQQAETIKLITWLCNDIDSGMTSTWHAKLQNHLDGMAVSTAPGALQGEQLKPSRCTSCDSCQGFNTGHSSREQKPYSISCDNCGKEARALEHAGLVQAWNEINPRSGEVTSAEPEAKS